MNRNLLFLLSRVYTIKSSRAEFQKVWTCRSGIVALLPTADPLSGRVVNSIRVPFFVRPPARSPVLSRNSIRKAGGMHQLVKLRYLTCLYPFPPSGGQRTFRSLISYDILSFSLVARARLWLVTKISIFVSRSFENARRKYLTPFREATFLPTHPAIFTGPAFWLVLLESLWYTYSGTYFSNRVRRDTLSLSDLSLEKESFRRKDYSFAVSFSSRITSGISHSGEVSRSLPSS